MDGSNKRWMDGWIGKYWMDGLQVDVSMYGYMDGYYGFLDGGDGNY